jgi:Dolichyl-phosphate-mannose-protein mannosyltransferase
VRLTQRLARDWRERARPEQLALLALGVLLAGAIALRAWLMLAYGPAFVGFGDSHEYVTAATLGVFHDLQKPAGYPIFLRVVHLLSDSLSFTILVQHLLGLATGVVLYAAVKRTGAPAWLGLVPAAVVFFGGTGLLLEHSLLADGVFAFVQALGLYAALRALCEPGLRWALLAGLAIGASFWVKTVGLSSAVLVPALLAVLAPGSARRRLLSAACAAGAVVVVILGYAVAQAAVTGYLGYEREGAWNLYGRVATFVDCSHFTPPAGTRFLCPSDPPAHRRSESFYQYARAAPAVVRFGGPAHAPASANALLERFSVAAIEHQPIAYAGAILRGLSFYFSPRAGEGYTPQSIREALLERKGVHSIEPALARYYPGSHGYDGSAGAEGALDSYERHTRIQGPLLIVALLAAAIGTPLLGGRARSGAILFTLTAILSVALAAAGNSYDARYGYPAFGPLAAGAALGAWGLATRLRQRRRRSAVFHAS